jgi:chemotaxis protein MotB
MAAKDKNSGKPPRPRIKKVKGHGGHHGGAWKVAYADFVTAMMALFLVLWLVSQADVKLKEAIANYFRSPGVFSSMEGGVLAGPKTVSKDPSSLTAKDDEQALVSVAQALRKNFEKRPEFTSLKDRVKIEVTKEGLKIHIVDKVEKVSFSSGSAELTSEAQAILTEIGNAICQLPNPITIGGHTDKAVFPEGSTYTNWELSADRANAARRALEAACVKPNQIRRIVGFADTELLVPDDPYSPSNRRISITVLRLLEDPKAQNDKPEENGGEQSKEQIEEKALPTSSTNEKAKTISEERENPTEEKVKNTPLETSAKSEETKRQKAKLAKEGSVVVGEPDAIPQRVKKTRELTQPKKESDEN